MRACVRTCVRADLCLFARSWVTKQTGKHISNSKLTRCFTALHDGATRPNLNPSISVNTHIQTGKFTTQFNIAKIICIYKKSKKISVQPTTR